MPNTVERRTARAKSPKRKETARRDSDRELLDRFHREGFRRALQRFDEYRANCEGMDRED